MHLKGKPVQSPGERNIDCLYYNGCLTHAAKRHWQHLSCSRCPNRSIKQPTPERLSRLDHNLTTYELSPDVDLVVREGFLSLITEAD